MAVPGLTTVVIPSSALSTPSTPKWTATPSAPSPNWTATAPSTPSTPNWTATTPSAPSPNWTATAPSPPSPPWTPTAPSDFVLSSLGLATPPARPIFVPTRTGLDGPTTPVISGQDFALHAPGLAPVQLAT